MSFEEAVRKALRQLSETNTVMEDLRGLLSTYTGDIDSLPERQKRFDYQEKAIAEKDDKIRSLEVTLATVRRVDQEKEEEYDSRREELEREVEERIDTLQKEKVELDRGRAEVEKRIRIEAATKKVKEIKGLKEKVEKLEEDKEKAEQRGEKLEKENEKLKEVAKRKGKELEKCKEDLEICEEEKKMHARKNKNFLRKVKELEEEFVVESKPTDH
jgi:chromosome segregation ATPase